MSASYSSRRDVYVFRESIVHLVKFDSDKKPELTPLPELSAKKIADGFILLKNGKVVFSSIGSVKYLPEEVDHPGIEDITPSSQNSFIAKYSNACWYYAFNHVEQKLSVARANSFKIIPRIHFVPERGLYIKRGSDPLLFDSEYRIKDVIKTGSNSFIIIGEDGIVRYAFMRSLRMNNASFTRMVAKFTPYTSDEMRTFSKQSTRLGDSIFTIYKDPNLTGVIKGSYKLLFTIFLLLSNGTLLEYSYNRGQKESFKCPLGHVLDFKVTEEGDRYLTTRKGLYHSSNWKEYQLVEEGSFFFDSPMPSITVKSARK